MKSIKNFAGMFVLLLAVWLLLNSALSTEIIISGIIVSALISALFCTRLDVFCEVKWNFKSILYMGMYLGVFFTELVKANLDVARRVVSPKLPINPGIVKVKSKLKSKIGRLILANSITLTPGTFTIEVDGEDFFIHWIDVETTDIEKATSKLVAKFETYLEVIYG